ncbi:granule-bound starch synthase [Tanacetum coccineum]
MAGGSSELPLRLEVLAIDDINHKFPSSVHKVLSNDDLLMEILLRLPVVSLHIFKPVCKQWISLITSPTFTLTRTRSPTVDPPSGLIIGRWSDPFGYDFVSFDPRIPAKRSILFRFNLEVRTVESCNGLLLCYIPGPNDKYCVCNPLINMFKMLPRKHTSYYERNGIDDMKMAFDPNKSHHYKVVHVGGIEYDGDDNYEFNYSIRILLVQKPCMGVNMGLDHLVDWAGERAMM